LPLVARTLAAIEAALRCPSELMRRG